MTESKLTPGPWVVQVSTDSDGNDTNDIKSKSLKHYGLTVASGVDNDDDAFLLAAALEMKDALKWFLEIVNGIRAPYTRKNLSVAIYKARAAFKKAHLL